MYQRSCPPGAPVQSQAAVRLRADIDTQGAGNICGRVCETEAVLSSSDDKVLDVLALEDLGGRDMGDGLPIIAIGGEDNANLLRVVLSNFEAVCKPTQIELLDGDAGIVATSVG